MTTAVLFDLDETLVQFDRSFEAIVEDACLAAGLAPPAELPRRYVELFFEHLEGVVEDPYHDAAVDLCAEFGLGVEPAGFAEHYVEHEVDATYVPDAVHDVLGELAGERPLGVLTNGVDPVQRRKLDAHGLTGYFDDVVTATDVGLLKPDLEIFRLARRRLPADEYVYVGDSVAHDVRPAKELGFGTVLVGDGVAADGGPPDHADLHVPDPDDFGRVRRILE